MVTFSMFWLMYFSYFKMYFVSSKDHLTASASPSNPLQNSFRIVPGIHYPIIIFCMSPISLSLPLLHAPLQDILLQNSVKTHTEFIPKSLFIGRIDNIIILLLEFVLCICNSVIGKMSVIIGKCFIITFFHRMLSANAV